MRTTKLTHKAPGLLALGVAVLAGSVQLCSALTSTNDRSYISFPSSNMTAYSMGLPYSSGGGADLALDRANNPHIISSEGDIGHRGGVQYRRWTHATAAWSAAYLSFESGNGLDDNYHAVITVDDADRVHVLYHHRTAATTSGDTTTPYGLYHAWCTNASGATPLTLGNWTKTLVSPTIPEQRQSGSLICIGSNLLLYARGNADGTGDGYWDIRMERAEWNGSGWDWSQMGVVVTVASSHLHTPVLTYDRTNDILHMALRDDSYIGTPRAQAYTQSSQPTNPVAGSWVTPVWHGAINSTWKEGNGGTGILQDGRAVAVTYLGANRDNMGADPRNWTRVREVGAAGTWSSWVEAFPGDTRGFGQDTRGYGSHTGFAPDGFGGLFMAYGKTLVIHWDPVTEEWYDVFTNLPGSDETKPVGPIDTVPAAWPDLSTLYYYSRNTKTLYVGQYLQHEPPPAGSVLIIE